MLLLFPCLVNTSL